VSLIHIDAEVPALAQTLRDASGDYRSIPLEQLTAWQSAAP